MEVESFLFLEKTLNYITLFSVEHGVEMHACECLPARSCSAAARNVRLFAGWACASRLFTYSQPCTHKPVLLLCLKMGCV